MNYEPGGLCATFLADMEAGYLKSNVKEEPKRGRGGLRTQQTLKFQRFELLVEWLPLNANNCLMRNFSNNGEISCLSDRVRVLLAVTNRAGNTRFHSQGSKFCSKCFSLLQQ